MFFYIIAFIFIWLLVVEKVDVDSNMNEAEENVKGYCHSTSLHAVWKLRAKLCILYL